MGQLPEAIPYQVAALPIDPNTDAGYVLEEVRRLQKAILMELQRTRQALNNLVVPHLTVSCSSALGQQAVTIDQDDVDQAFIDFQGTSEAGVSKNLTSWTTGATLTGYLKIEINGTAYWMPFYTAPSS
jgi:hypothetical protein